MAAMVNIRGRHGGSRRARRRPMSEINVTPMVDVMLVLLVVFMVTAPLLTVGVQVELPKTKASVISGHDEPLAVSIDKKGRIYVQDTEVKLSTLTARLMAISHNNPGVRIFVRGDENIDYGRVMTVIGVLNGAGFQKVALITRQVHPSAPTPSKTPGR
ncbi:protein TolR [Varunaivibrio sulfuroxidans]|uniref:Cell division and transport-associated protein TolR n=1 Tax=Varunaivibrio sulfuroxidans TaxID=1773489 RepID=A0A4R3JEQ0_9PROT|nr:protein TolR [Varunaivibrio sulfuroxidans]TCS63150.1 cell division and transport-associated protein TolR [Varunaivibrio sulfuroxidans]WES31785.1 protein TolR [Varunaivibrio sulfuroxidans]